MAFDKFDTNGDDRLDYREFCEMIRRQAEEKEARETQSQRTNTAEQGRGKSKK